MKPQGEGMDNVLYMEEKRAVPAGMGMIFWGMVAGSLFAFFALGMVVGFLLRGCM